MATSVGSRIGLAVLLFVLVATATSQLAGASQITFFQSIGCTGNSLSVVKCGECYNLTMYGGYQFVYSDGQPVTFYYNYDCSNQAGTLDYSATSCGGLKFTRSIILGCSSFEATAAE